VKAAGLLERVQVHRKTKGTVKYAQLPSNLSANGAHGKDRKAKEISDLRGLHPVLNQVAYLQLTGRQRRPSAGKRVLRERVQTE
jgi:hypothetical protein